jgi:transposase-like protein
LMARVTFCVWIEQTEGAKFRMKVFTELCTRGGEDIPIAVTDGLKGCPRRSRRSIRPRPGKRVWCT